MGKILVTGARGQLGSDLVVALRQHYGEMEVIETGRQLPGQVALKQGVSKPESLCHQHRSLLYEVLDVTDRPRLQELIQTHQIDTIYHLAGLLSAKGEQQPNQCWDININGLRNVLEAAKTYGMKVFFPSSIAVFGPHSPKLDTPQITISDPSTMYGITKLTGELLCHYYAYQWGVDVRSLRLPGIISYNTFLGGGTTDFAVEMFHAALKNETYTCFIHPETRLPMMYISDAIQAILTLMQADPAVISIRTSYNIAAISFSARELVTEIQKHLPDFVCHYKPDFRQAIADSWPSVIDDSRARADWGWRHTYHLPAIVEEMLAKLSHKKVLSFEF
ncbi:NAD-dependent epimerase/dehydratase family protein (plasmid) [Kovacikia minuta CCNUW1]|uniref:NAD-dependent epimerase/dehydratase family protein n=1 Tax=Kovacikia minuta TaxID=2931930 RepID=UPI001CCD26F2|nr:NAD-dependent epimerase/dehydratase family protein [Kovacikia minuta]UBF29973.1 NAD-dependent epimerase/dehydratase family protein [Kovacikia minuta CCNUW1]